MMCRTVFSIVVLSYFPALNAQTPEARREALAGLQREAARFLERAPQLQARETLTQTLRSMPGAKPSQRTLVSDYGFLALEAGEMREIRVVRSVDGKPVKRKGDPLKDLAQSLLAAGDNQRRRLLESFEKHGLQGVAVNFGPVIQMFSGDKMLKFEFTFQRMDQVRGVPLAVYRFEQIDGAGGLTIYSNGQPIRQKLRGEVWVTPSTGSPARIVLDSVFEEGPNKMRDVTNVDYAESEFGALLPFEVVHRQFRDRTLLVEDVFRYSEYHTAQ